MHDTTHRSLRRKSCPMCIRGGFAQTRKATYNVSQKYRGHDARVANSQPFGIAYCYTTQSRRVNPCMKPRNARADVLNT